MENLRVAIVHDRLAGYGTEERVLGALHEIYPTAPVFLGWIDPPLARFLGVKLHSQGVKLPSLPIAAVS